MKSKLPRELRSQINKKTHAWGISYAEQSKQQLLNELENMRAHGASQEDVKKYLAYRPPPVSVTL